MGERHIYYAWVEMNADQVEYTMYNPYTKTDMEWICTYPDAELKLVKLMFDAGSGGVAFLRILYDRTPIAPRDGKGFGVDGFTCDDDTMPIYLDRKLKKGDRVGFQFKNLDVVIHKAYISLEIEPRSPKGDNAFERKSVPDDIPGTSAFKRKKDESTVSPLDRETGGW